MSITTTFALVSLLGAAAFFIAGLLAGVRRERQGGVATDAAARLGHEMEDQHRRAREQLEGQLDELRGALAAAEARAATVEQETAGALEHDLTDESEEPTAVGGEDLSQQLAQALEREQELANERDGLSAERELLATKIEELRQQQQKMAGEADGRRQREKTLTGEVGQLRQREKTLTGEVGQLRQREKKLTGAAAAVRGELRSEASELRHEVAALRQQVSDLRGEKVQLEKDRDKAFEQRDGALAELATTDRP